MSEKETTVSDLLKKAYLEEDIARSARDESDLRKDGWFDLAAAHNATTCQLRRELEALCRQEEEQEARQR